MKNEFAISEIPTGHLNAVVKNIMKQTGENDATEAVRLFNSGEWILSKSPKPSILKFLGTIDVPATTKQFVARDKFVVNTDDDAPVKISYVRGNFKNWFLGKVEELIAGQTLRYGKLRESSVDGPIIVELDGETKAETTLAEMFSLMKKQGNGESGALLTNGYANIFYIRDCSGVLRTVSVYWDGVGWGLLADGVSDPDAWNAGRQVFSRKPLET